MAKLSLTLRAEHYPIWSQEFPKVIKRVDVFAQTTSSVSIADKADGTGNRDALALDHALNLQVGTLAHIPLPSPLGTFSLFLNTNAMEELWLAVIWGKEA